MERFRGRTITFRFEDGVMANKAFAHTFTDEGDISYKPADSDGEGRRAQESRVEKLRDDVWVVSYRGGEGTTLTSVLDFASNRLVSFASNGEDLTVQHGTFETARDAVDTGDQSDAHATPH